ncbi:MAG: hypothetical protein IT340_22240 [Chloroflexi bacterium]|nr:hypothetical protein [Chloroflexota bacterium]
MPTSPSPVPTLDYLHPIVAVEDEALILRDGTLLALLRCRSSGLALRTDDEADALVQALKRQLLALRGLTQVVIDVAPVDVRRFLAGHQRATRDEPDPRLARLAAHQRQYIAQLGTTRRILAHQSYLVVAVPPPLLARRRGAWRQPATGPPPETPAQRHERRRELTQQAGRVVHLFAGLGIEAARLTTRQLGEVVQCWADPERGARRPSPVVAADLATGPVVLAGQGSVTT